MGSIKKLPQHLINRLKAGEIVERPASVVKELLENSLDAGANDIQVDIERGGKHLIKIADNGTGITKDDLLLTIERYATSKITQEKDLFSIASYGFRGEALATISEVSGFRIQTRNQQANVDGVGYELWRDGQRFITKDVPFVQPHGTIVYVEDIFHAVPAREKFLKTDSTERGYIKKLVLQYALIHRDKKWSLLHNGKQIIHVLPTDSLMQRVIDLTKADREQKLKVLEFQDEQLHMYGLVGDANLHFPKADWLHLFVNGRPVEDRLIKRAVMDAYQRQIVPGTYPFALICIDIDPKIVDVNVHPRKQQVKFLDPGSIFNRVKGSIQQSIGHQQVNYAAFNQQEVRPSSYSRHTSSSGGLTTTQMENLKSVSSSIYGTGHQQGLGLQHNAMVSSMYSGEQTASLTIDEEPVSIVGQLWNSYILLQGAGHLYQVDQHALAERITFEKMRKEVKKNGFSSEVLLQPLTVNAPKIVDIDEISTILSPLGFDISAFGAGKAIIHALPKVFYTYKIDIELVMQFVWHLEEKMSHEHIFSVILDEILGMKACKASIKAGQKLSMVEMQQLIQDGVTHIDGLFVCQHGRPSIVATNKHDIDELFDR